MAGARSETTDRNRLVFGGHAGVLGLSTGQMLVVCGLSASLILGMITRPDFTLASIVLGIQICFVVCAAWRVLLLIVGRPAIPSPPEPTALPAYTVLVALHDEAEILPQLVDRLERLDYPRDRLQGFLLLEAHDLATVYSALSVKRPAWLDVLIVPSGSPQTKPRALNHGLAYATGDLVTVYDAEDDPDPCQLREAAARFAADSGGRLGCLQAPLRIRRLDRSMPASAFLDRQFAVEYAALFEVTLPAMSRLGLPFPLGGTSNHFRADALRAVGGWDPHNVTEDADLGFRLWREGWRQGMLARPTYETPPGDLHDWLPQRTRWIKGYMQTWGVHSRDPRGLGWRGCLSLVLTLGAAIGSASAHAVALAWLAASVLIAGSAGLTPATPLFAIGVMAVGTLAAWLTCLVGARRGKVAYTANDMVMAPAYWSLLTLAFVHAVWRLVREPHAWDKTPHKPDGQAIGDLHAGRQAA